MRGITNIQHIAFWLNEIILQKLSSYLNSSNFYAAGEFEVEQA